MAALAHQMPPSPRNLRVKAWRRLQALGAVPLKNSVYVLPNSGGSVEDFHWLLKEIVDGGGEGFMCEARFLAGLADEKVVEIFNAARDADYGRIAEEAMAAVVGFSLASEGAEEGRMDGSPLLNRLRKRLTTVTGIDFFNSPGRKSAEAALDQLDKVVNPWKASALPKATSPGIGDFAGRTWVTRKGVYADRMACAWLVRRFVDAEAAFRFVDAGTFAKGEGEVLFDVFEGDFAHEGDMCTLEVMLGRLGMDDPGLVPIAEIIHDIDLKCQWECKSVPALIALKKTPFSVCHRRGVMFTRVES